MFTGDLWKYWGSRPPPEPPQYGRSPGLEALPLTKAKQARDKADILARRTPAYRVVLSHGTVVYGGGK